MLYIILSWMVKYLTYENNRILGYILVCFYDSNEMHCYFIGAKADIQNNDGKKPIELTKDPETAALLKQAGKSFPRIIPTIGESYKSRWSTKPTCNRYV